MSKFASSQKMKSEPIPRKLAANVELSMPLISDKIRCCLLHNEGNIRKCWWATQRIHHGV